MGSTRNERRTKNTIGPINRKKNMNGSSSELDLKPLLRPSLSFWGHGHFRVKRRGGRGRKKKKPVLVGRARPQKNPVLQSPGMTKKKNQRGKSGLIPPFQGGIGPFTIKKNFFFFSGGGFFFGPVFYFSGVLP